MDFNYVMRKILPNYTGTDGNTYVSYINGAGNVLDDTRTNRSDYDDISPTTSGYRKDHGKRTIHGVVDIYYYKENVPGQPESTTSTDYPNKENKRGRSSKIKIAVCRQL